MPLAIALLLASLPCGKGPERLSAAVLVASPALSAAAFHVPGLPITLGRMMIAHFAADSVILLALLLIAVEANRIYPLVLAALQLLILLTQLAQLFDGALTSKADELLLCGPAWLEMAVLTLGLLFHTWRERHWGPTRSWRKSGDPPFNLPPNF